MSSELLTINEIAELLDEPQNRVAYMIAKHRIKHVKHIGNTRVFDSAVIARVKELLFDIQIRK